jgi:hypothetical protein
VSVPTAPGERSAVSPLLDVRTLAFRLALALLTGQRDAMTAGPEIIVAIGEAVEAQNGTLADALDLAQTWERLAADKRGRVDRLRYDAAHPRCSCADGGASDDGRCERCAGLIRREATR